MLMYCRFGRENNVVCRYVFVNRKNKIKYNTEHPFEDPVKHASGNRVKAES